MGKGVIPDEIKCAIFDFTQRAKEIPNLLSATLFGSVVSGDLSKKSDIVVLEGGPLKTPKAQGINILFT